MIFHHHLVCQVGFVMSIYNLFNRSGTKHCAFSPNIVVPKPSVTPRRSQIGRKTVGLIFLSFIALSKYSMLFFMLFHFFNQFFNFHSLKVLELKVAFINFNCTTLSSMINSYISSKVFLLLFS